MERRGSRVTCAAAGRRARLPLQRPSSHPAGFHRPVADHRFRTSGEAHELAGDTADVVGKLSAATGYRSTPVTATATLLLACVGRSSVAAVLSARRCAVRGVSFFELGETHS